MKVDFEKVTGIIREGAEKYILSCYKKLKDGDVEEKTGPRDLVTKADKECEAYLEEVLPKLIKGSVVIGEEGVSEGRTSLEAMQENTKIIWVVDPVDGTINFVNQTGKFAVLVALVHKGATIGGWIHDPTSGQTIVAESGGGSRLDGKRLMLSQDAVQLNQIEGFADLQFFKPEVATEINRLRPLVKQIHGYACAAHEYWDIATGKSHFVMFTHGKPWDHLAGVLAIEEAGGKVKTTKGERYYPHTQKPDFIAASNEAVLNAVYNELDL